MYVPATHDSSPWVLLASATMNPQTRQIAKVRTANSTVISAPCSSAGISRAMKRGSNGTSVFVVVVEALRRRVLLHPFMIPGDVLAVARPIAQFANPGIKEQPPFEIARFQEDRIL